MTLQQWLDRLHHELKKRGLPSGYSARLMEELTDHFTDIQMENQGMDAQPSADETLGSPELLATSAQKEFYGQTFAGRYRLRKIFGILTLVTALVCMGGWIRGFAVCDIATYSYIQGWQRLNASCYGLVWFRFKNDDINVKYGNELQVAHHPLKNASGRLSANGPHPVDFHFSSEDDETIWHWQAFGFHFGETIDIKDGLRMSLWAIPYWSIVVPLTLFSAFLLLIKPRTPNQAKITEPTANKGAGEESPALA